MRIGIDARLWYETGVGRYIRALVHNLIKIDKKNKYVLFLKSNAFYEFKIPNNNWQKRLADVSWHSINEQLLMPKIYQEANVDLIHIPYFSVPILTTIPYVVTIHDLTISDYITGTASTKPKLIYWIKKLGYKQVINRAVHKSKIIITVSQTVKKQLIQKFGLNPKKIQVTYESGEFDNEVLASEKKIDHIPKEYLLFVGNAYPHKNLISLVKAFEIIKPNFSELKLILVGKSDYFYSRLKSEIKNSLYYDSILFTGKLNNLSLVNLYKNAEIFIFPSLFEGFGIPGLEAMLAKCPLLVSDIPVFKEIYGNAACYFNPNSINDLAQKISLLLNSEVLRKKLIIEGNKQVKKYSWEKMAKETLNIYESCSSL